MNALIFGEILFDRINNKEHVGGAPCNVSVHLARHKANVRLISKIGADKRGAHLKTFCQSQNIDTELIQTDNEHPTSVVDVFLNNKKEPDFTVHEDVAWDYIRADHPLHDALEKEYDIFYFGTLAARAPESERTLKALLKYVQAKTRFYDINIRKDYYTKERIIRGCNACNTLKLNENECTLISELIYNEALPEAACVTRLQNDFDIPCICVTKGSDGATVYGTEGTRSAPAPQTTPLDTTGAGDAFAAAFAFARAAGETEASALDRALRLAAFVVSCEGAIPHYDPKDIM